MIWKIGDLVEFLDNNVYTSVRVDEFSGLYQVTAGDIGLIVGLIDSCNDPYDFNDKHLEVLLGTEILYVEPVAIETKSI